MFKTICGFFVVLLFCISIIAQSPNEGTPAWKVTLKTNIKAPSSITAQNRCRKKHKFEIRPENVSFLEFSTNKIEVKGGKNKTVPIFFNTTGLAAGVYEGKVLVICLTCKKEPTCSQDRETLPVILTVPGNPIQPQIKTAANTATANSKDPCERFQTRCDELLKTYNAKKAIANAKQGDADKAREAFNKAEKEAKDAEQAATAAEALADFKPPTGRGSVDGGQEYTTADSAYLAQMNAQVTADYNAGLIDVDEHQKRLKENTIEKARKERIKNEAKLKKEAEEARRKANDARKEADKAKTKADNAQRAADDAKAEAEKARKAYEECVKKAEDECNKFKKQQDEARKKAEQDRIIAEAERERKEAQEAIAATEERKRKEAEAERIATEERKRAAADEFRQKQNVIFRTIFRQMYDLGFISSSEIDENKVYLGFLPRFSGNSVEQTLEDGSIPKEVLEAFREMTLVRDPCGSNIVKKAAWNKLEQMINPRTGRRYTDSEAQTALEEMCKIMRRLGTRQDELKKREL